MSEFSDGYFLKSDDSEEAVNLLKKADVEGYVYPAKDGWVAFVANTTPRFRFSEKLKAVNTGILVQFVNAEDHGWGFEICVENASVCGYFCAYNDDMDAEELYLITREVEKEGFEQLLKEAEGKFGALRKYFDENTKIEDIANVDDFKEEMEFYFSDWISYHYAELENGEFGKYGEYENLKLIKVN